MGNKGSSKNSFIFEYGWYQDIFCNLSNEERGILLTAICDFEIDGVIPDDSFFNNDRLLISSFKTIQRRLIFNKGVYDQRCKDQGLKSSKKYEDWQRAHPGMSGSECFRMFKRELAEGGTEPQPQQEMPEYCGYPYQTWEQV